MASSQLVKPVLPFVKWPGGKRWAAKGIVRIVQTNLTDEGRYIEPFLGGGAVFFHLRPRRALLGDINSELIEVYRTVRQYGPDVIAKLRRWSVDEDTYLNVRASKPRSPVGRAARFLSLNRTAFGGVYRLNAAGEFNVPFGGRSHELLWKRGILHDAARALRGAALYRADFARLIRMARAGDVVFCDPTYTVAHDNNGFVRYNEKNFSWADQVRLAKEAKAARERGATVLVTNAHHRSLRQLYSGEQATVLRRSSTVSRKLSGRRRVAEYLFVLRPSTSTTLD